MNWKQKISYFITKNRKSLSYISHLNTFLLHAFLNKNNNHFLNGEHWFQEKISFIKPKTIFDVGANKGEWSELVANIYPDALILAFEPVPEIFLLMQQKLAAFSSSKLHLAQIALSDTAGEIVFYQNAKQSLFSSLYPREDNQTLKEIKVETIKGDIYCRENGIDTIDFLKIDVEGAELKVLKGFYGMLEKGKIRVIQFEYGEMYISARTFLKDCFDLLIPLGYKIGKLFPDGVEFVDYTYELDNFKWANYVAVLPSEKEFINKIAVLLPN